MATTRRPPSGPIGNSPRDVRDDFVGVPADDIKAGEPPRWPPGPKRITKNTFHAKVSGNTPPKRGDRSPHYRRGGWVSGYADGGAISTAKEIAVQRKRDRLPGEQKNDPTAPQNVRGKPVVAKRQFGGSFGNKPADNNITKPLDTVPAKRAGGGHLSAAQRQSLPKSDFARPGKGEGPKGAGSGSYPINDPSHARNALARSSGKPEASAVRAKVKAKYPNIGKD